MEYIYLMTSGVELGGARFGFSADRMRLAADTGLTSGGSSIEIPEAFLHTIPEYSEGKLLAGKVALITGVGRGKNNSIGPAIARAFGDQGARLMLTATEGSREQGEQIVEELQSRGVEAYWTAAGLTEPGEPQRLIDETVSRFGRLDIVGANHGIRRDGAFEELGDEAYKEVFDVNVLSTVRLLRPAFKQMRTQSPRGGVLLATTSVANEGSAGQAPYSASKGAVRSLMRTLAREGALFRIRANSVAPGIVTGTEMTRDLTDKQVGRILKLTETPEPITPQDVARAYLYFAAETTGNLTGQEMQVLYRGQVQGV